MLEVACDAIHGRNGREEQTMITLQLDRDIEERLEALGASSDSSKADMVRERLLDALDDELRDLRLAQERLREPARRWKQEELEQGLDLDG